MRTLNTYLKTSQAKLMTVRAFPESIKIKQNQRQERREKSYAITLKSIQLKKINLPVCQSCESSYVRTLANFAGRLILELDRKVEHGPTPRVFI